MTTRTTMYRQEASISQIDEINVPEYHAVARRQPRGYVDVKCVSYCTIPGSRRTEASGPVWYITGCLGAARSSSSRVG